MNKQFQEILNLSHSGSNKLALKKCKSILKKKPREVNILLLAASIYAQNNDMNSVVSYCEKVLHVDPLNQSALYNAGVAFLSINKHEKAKAVLEKLTNIAPEHASGHTNLCLAYWHLGDYEKALETGLTATKLAPDSATSHSNLGLVYLSLNNYTDSQLHSEKAISLDPSLVSAYYNLALAKLDAGNDNGNSDLDKALSINPDYPEANHRKALFLYENNKISESLYYFKKAISSKTDFYEAYCNYGNALSKEQQFNAAEAAYRKAIEIKPDYAGAYNNLGNALLDQDDFRKNFKEAEKCYLKAIEIIPDLYDAYKNLAVCYQGEGLSEKALHYFKIYNKHIPGDQVVIAGMASVYERNGDYDEGMQLIEPFLNNSALPEVLLSFAKLSVHFDQIAEAIKSLENINDADINSKIQREKYFLLGKLCEKQKVSEKAFKYYKKANDLDQDKHDIKHSEKIFKNITNYFTKNKIATLKRSTIKSTLPIFIVGMPRSGTSLAEQILASHPDVYGAGELENLHHLVQKIGNDLMPRDSYPSSMDNMSTDFANDLTTSYLNTIKEMSPDSKHIVDKMPHNFLGLGVINILFPEATVIHCKRSSIDTCLSIYFQHFNKHHSYSNNLEILGDYYNLYDDLMNHWKSVLDLNIVELQYEDVISNPENEIKKLLEHCNIDWHPNCLNFHKNKRTVMTPSYDQVRRPIYNSSVAKWKKYEQYIQPLIEHLGNKAY